MKRLYIILINKFAALGDAILNIPLVFFIVILMLAGCGGKGEPGAVRFDIGRAPRSLDPQTATDDAGILVISNIFEGLVRLSEQGDPLPAAAVSWEISPDKLTYTFSLREDARWSDGSALTADDFVFALRRIVDPLTKSPHVASYLALQNAAEIAEGTLSPEQLGAVAVNARTLRLTLSHPDEKLLRHLASTSAMPCKEQFFYEQKGRYGLSPKAVLSNGPLTLVGWSTEFLTLEPNAQHPAPPQLSILYLCIGRGNPVELFLSGRSEVCLIPYREAAGAQGIEGRLLFDESWALVVNPESFVGKDETLRRALLSSLDRDALFERLPKALLPTDNLVSPAAMLGGSPYRERAGELSPLPMTKDVRGLFWQQLSELDVKKLPQTTLLVSDAAPGADLGMLMQRQWSDLLSVNINMEQQEQETLGSRLLTGSYALMLAPLSSDNSSPEGYLARFSSFPILMNGEESTVSQQLALLSRLSGSEAAAGYRKLEQALVDGCFVLPLYHAPSVFAVAKTVGGVEYDLFSRTVYFGNAVFLKK